MSKDTKQLSKEQALEKLETISVSKSKIFADSVIALSKANGKALTPEAIGKLIGKTAKDVRHSFQSQGFKGTTAVIKDHEENAVIPNGKWLNFCKASNRVVYGLTEQGTALKV